MTAHRLPRIAGRAPLALTGATAVLLTLTAPTASASAPDTTDVPAAGAPVACVGIGTLVGAGGFLEQRESTRVDAQGRAHVLFAIAARDVVLTGPDGSRYRLLGAGHDTVLYRGSDVTGEIVWEDEAFVFDVVGRTGVAGVVRFWLHTGPDQVPHVHDSSTCQLPNMS